MKIIFMILMVFSLLQSNEMQRIEAIVEDISELREDYEICQKELENRGGSKMSAITIGSEKYKNLYLKEKKKNTILKAELDFTNDLDKSIVNLSKKIRKLEKELLYQYNLLQSKEKTIKKLKANQKKSIVYANNNTFPKLVMKEKFKSKPKIKKIDKEKIIKFKAASFELKADSIVYDSINGQNIDEWVATTSFTSNTKTQHWIKVSGYFVDKKWRPSKKEMWIKKAQVFKK